MHSHQLQNCHMLPIRMWRLTANHVLKLAVLRDLKSIGGWPGVRTLDRPIKSRMLYQLS